MDQSMSREHYISVAKFPMSFLVELSPLKDQVNSIKE